KLTELLIELEEEAHDGPKKKSKGKKPPKHDQDAAPKGQGTVAFYASEYDLLVIVLLLFVGVGALMFFIMTANKSGTTTGRTSAAPNSSSLIATQPDSPDGGSTSDLLRGGSLTGGQQANATDDVDMDPRYPDRMISFSE